MLPANTQLNNLCSRTDLTYIMKTTSLSLKAEDVTQECKCGSGKLKYNVGLYFIL